MYIPFKENLCFQIKLFSEIIDRGMINLTLFLYIAAVKHHENSKNAFSALALHETSLSFGNLCMLTDFISSPNHLHGYCHQ